ncbi:LPS export ABC transporter periplasmic protein LptC [Ferruginivarius sediminum]|uniref:LPS export ABC transporter periplasmic protein LptC n=1 Tax=Ferruginivarius sediminum TaxID=2661937 RepID=A0A369T873_9PROT|nr:LPS export ABC transporter periplasmic protein LptC [Ferruginivarius sediminum]RDD61529.1 LPS export ABC transporter periplasmic protein LptC [Ferruginivarius sediminum]
MANAADKAQAPQQAPGSPRAPRGGESARTRQPPRLSVRNGYSLFVGTLKVVLPALAVAMVLLVIVWPQFAPDESSFRVGISDLSPDQADNLSMLNARFRGRDEQNRPFSIVADQATQAKSGADLIKLQQPKADITLQDGAWLALTADDGQYWRETQKLHLSGNVSLFHDRGFEMHTSAADIDLKANRAQSDRPVQGQGPTGNLEAEGFRLEDGGKRIFFTGKSKLTVYENGLEGQP